MDSNKCLFDTKPKILIAFPPNAEKLGGIKNIMFPLGVGYVASMLRHKFSIKCHDFNLDLSLGKYSTQRVEKILKMHEYDFLLIGGVFPKYQCLKEIIDVSRKMSKAKIVLGGSYIEPLIKSIHRYSEADYYVIGEGEHTIVNLMCGLMDNTPLEEISGIAYPDGPDIVINKLSPFIDDLDDIPFPSRDLFAFHYYKRYFATGYPLMYAAHLIASRGCPFNCIFCRPGFGRKIRARSAENVFEEMKMLEKDYGCTFFMFLDEVIFGKKSNIINFCEYILSKSDGRLKYYWGGNTNARLLDYETLRLMKRAGCLRIAFGVESGSETILKEMRKKNDLNQIKDIVKYCDTLGIGVFFNLMTNTFSETNLTLNETKEYLKYLNKFNFIQPNSILFLVPIPGTDLYDEAKRKNLIPDDDLQNMLSLSSGTKFSLLWNLTSMQDREFQGFIKKINKELHDDYYSKHKMQYLLKKYTNLTHFRFNETVSNFSPKNTRCVFEGLLWVLCRGNDESPLGRFYKKFVYKNYLDDRDLTLNST